ncbi:YitT family protein [Haliovirga abyssi]|uniref:Membrane protein n=1 Tax=Haliovirga abyssi TaxID=2996794 RepID=A0AAU9DR22_9FUSO|nr:YitT family protein [Haliovirga abyssi]BDU50983.1 membrane protein [Haliovirga abyssi]
MTRDKKRFIKDFIIMNFALILASLGFVWFLIPSKIAAGGVSGIATIIYYLFHLPVGMVMLVLNIPLFLAGLKFFGKGYGFKTLYGTIMLSVYTDTFSYIFTLNGVTDNILLSSLYGGITTGIGIGLIMKIGGSTGGTDIIAQILHEKFKIQTGNALIGVDFIVLASAGIVFGMEPALYAIITLYTTGRMINVVLDGANYSKVAYIISDEYDLIRNMIVSDINRGGTVFYSKGLYTDKNKNVIMTVVKNKEIYILREKIKNIDEKAFIIITDAHEVLGEGFSPIGEKVIENK